LEEIQLQKIELTQKFRPKILPFPRNRRKNEMISLSMTSMTMFTPNQNLFTPKLCS